jgi:hypothetical protein
MVLTTPDDGSELLFPVASYGWKEPKISLWKINQAIKELVEAGLKS